MKKIYYGKTSKEDGIIGVVLKSVDATTLKGLRVLSIALWCLSIVVYFATTTNNSIIHISCELCFVPMLVGSGIALLLSSEKIRQHYMHLSGLEKSLKDSGVRFLRFNNLFIENNSTVVDSVHFRFQVEHGKILIILKSYGDRFADQIREMDNELVDLLELELTDKFIGVNEVTYVFRQKTVQPLNYTYTNWEQTPITGGIPLDSERFWNYDSLPHALISGSTGCGKTFLLFHLICMYIKCHAEIVIIDPKKSDLYSLKELNLPQLKAVECNIGPICKVLRETMDEMNQRYLQMQGHFGQTYRDLGLYPKVIIIDEIASLSASASKRDQDELNSSLKQLIFKGRQAGIQVILATQKPESEAIPTAIRDNLGLRVALGRMSSEGFRMVFGPQDFTYCSCPPGTGYIYINDQSMSLPQLFQAPRIEPLWSVIDEMKKSSRLGDGVPQAERADSLT